jgi:hypothetical protein
MKTNKIDLDIDFIGGLGPLTKIEEKELSDFFKNRKPSMRKMAIEKPQITVSPNVLA